MDDHLQLSRNIAKKAMSILIDISISTNSNSWNKTNERNNELLNEEARAFVEDLFKGPNEVASGSFCGFERTLVTVFVKSSTPLGWSLTSWLPSLRATNRKAGNPQRACVLSDHVY